MLGMISFSHTPYILTSAPVLQLMMVRERGRVRERGGGGGVREEGGKEGGREDQRVGHTFCCRITPICMC